MSDLVCQRTSLRKRLMVVGGLMIVASFVGCSYPTVSRDAYELTQTLHTLCDRRDASQLDAFEQILAQRVSDGSVTRDEQQLLQAIAAKARDGKWQAAKQSARELMLAQNTNAAS